MIVLNPGRLVFAGSHSAFSDSLLQINLNQSVDPAPLKNVLNRRFSLIFCFRSLFASPGNERSAELICRFVNPSLKGGLQAFGKGEAAHDPSGFFPFDKTTVDGV